MAKADYELAAEITQELIKARGIAISGVDAAHSAIASFTQVHLSAEAVADAYKVILKGVREGIRG